MTADEKSPIKKMPIKEFRLDRMADNAKVVCIGKPASGKSTLIRDIIKAYAHKYPVAKVISGTEENNHFYSDMFHSLFISSEFDEEELERFVKRQKLAKQTCNNPNALLILDDCSDDPKYLSRPLIQKYFKNGRHWDMMLILALQYGMDIKPVIKNNVDYTFIFRDPSIKNREKLFEHYAGIIGDYKDFCDIMDELANDYTAIVINNRTQSNDIHDCVFYYKAKIHKDDFKVGCAQFRQWGEQRYNKNHANEAVY